MGKIFVALIAMFMITSCNAKEGWPALTAAASALSNPSDLVKAHGKQSAELLKKTAPPRQVIRGARPEITLQRDGLRINGSLIALGQPMAEWIKVIPGAPRCDRKPSVFKIKTCVWDGLGIHLMEYRSTVFQFDIFFYLSPWDESESTGADGTVYPPEKDWRPMHPFTGYFEIDGYGIDGNTTFHDISVSVDRERGLHCGRVDDCSIRYGSYFDGRGALSLHTTRRDSHGHLTLFSIFADQIAYSGPPPPSECVPGSPEAKATGCAPITPFPTPSK